MNVAGIGDINGDSLGDLLFQAGGGGYVVFGRSEVRTSISGECPRELTIEIAGAAPNRRVAIFAGSEVGEFELTGGPCGGRTIAIAPRDLTIRGAAQEANPTRSKGFREIRLSVAPYHRWPASAR